MFGTPATKVTHARKGREREREREGGGSHERCMQVLLGCTCSGLTAWPPRVTALFQRKASGTMSSSNTHAERRRMQSRGVQRLVSWDN